MRRLHFSALQPVCPVCRSAENECTLQVGAIHREEKETIFEGLLLCPNRDCQREYPIFDGIPLIIPGIREYIAHNIFQISARADLGETSESILGDCCGPGSLFEALRQQLSSYTWDHYADLDPLEPAGEPRPGALVRLLKTGLEYLDRRPGPILDVGCSVGRTTFELADQCGELVLGIDLNFSMLRVAAAALNQGIVRYPRRRVGLVYDRREFPVRFNRPENVDFWACDAMALPFRDGAFKAAVAMNVLDSVHSPPELLRSLNRGLAPRGALLVACPYDWMAAATPLEGWLGGHSQRGPDRGDSEPMLRALLTPGAHPWSIEDLEITAERNWLPWHVRMHARSTVEYKVHLLAARKVHDE